MAADEDFDEFVRGRSLSLFRTAYFLTGDAGHAEDLVQDVLARVYARWRLIRTSPEAYARRAVVHAATNRWRARGRRPEVPMSRTPDRPGPHDHAQQVAEHQSLVAALAQLSPRQRAVLVLRYFDDLSEADTARLLGCAVGTVKSQSARGLAALRRLLDPNDRPLTTTEPR